MWDVLLVDLSPMFLKVRYLMIFYMQRLTN
jgi:hypothetical protein